MKHYLFSYGTLQLEKVQLETFGRELRGKQDTLKGYQLKDLVIMDKLVIEKSGKEIHPVAMKSKNPDDKITGVIFELSEQELNESDKYEVSDYKRILETFESGNKAWIYVASNHE
jgi:gamma-glutamylcyclotransferase (GGCT)/AIG2-like uncharacterized protein YtfP